MKNMEMKDLKKDLMKLIVWEEESKIAVKIYECDEVGLTFDVEVCYYLNGEFVDCLVSDTYDNEAEAMKRGKAVLRTVKGWFNYDREIEVENTVELYHM